MVVTWMGHACFLFKPRQGPTVLSDPPIHYKTSRIDFPIAGVEEFVRGKTNVRRVEGSDVQFLPESLPITTEIVVLNLAT